MHHQIGAIFASLFTISLFSCGLKQPVDAAKLKILIPLYAYPNWYDSKTYSWPKVAKAASEVPITAVINPNNGPDKGPPNKDYAKGLEDLRSAGVTILGYVFTNYGKRDISQIKAEIDLYDEFYNIDGIFLDEAASGADKLDYYQEIYKFIKAKSNLNTVVLNHGTQADPGYLARPAADTIVMFENYSRAWNAYQPESYVDRYEPEHFSTLIHSVADAATMKKFIELAVDRNVGYIYITDDSPDNPDRDPWNDLPSYWQEEVDLIRSLNQFKKSRGGFWEAESSSH